MAKLDRAPPWRDVGSVLFGFLVAPSLLIAAVSRRFELPWALLDLDLLAAALVGLLLHPVLGAIGATLSLLLAAAIACGWLFHFTAPDYLAAIAAGAARLDHTAVALIAGGILLASAGCVLGLLRVLRRVSSPVQTSAWVGGVLVLAVGGDLVNGTGPGGNATEHINIASSGALYCLRTWALRRHLRTVGDGTLPARSAAAVAGLTDAASLSDRPDLLLVLVESLGAPADTALRHELLAAAMPSPARPEVRVRFGAVRFQGSTVNGEIRELCGRLGAPDDIAAIGVRECLPMRLASLGYQTRAVHGFAAEMFGRDSWYPQLGFDLRLFRDDLAAAGLTRRCGTLFPGTCDPDVAAQIARWLSVPSTAPRFVYWLTLNMHLPLDQALARGTGRTCGPRASALGPAICDYEALTAWTLAPISQILDLPSSGRALRIVLVGDHAPPFLDPRLRHQFADDSVPYVILDRPAAPAAPASR